MGEFFAHCRDADPCTGFEVLCDTEAERDRVEAAHLSRWHAESPPATDDLCQQMFEQHADESEVIITAIEHVARMNNGRVDPNEVRGLIPPGITPQLVGSVYRVLRARGRLRPIGQTVNNDTHGRNTGKPLTVYQLIDDTPNSSRRTA